MTKKRIPDRWEKYLPMGCRVPGTRFLPFKVPLKPELCRSQPENERFTPSILLENTPMLRAVIDLTNTSRYYNAEEFTSRGVLHKKINIIGGGRIPPRKICEEFFDAVDQLSRSLDHDSDALIGVHCTHGLNRTGYLICKYMVLRMKIDPQEAINNFQEARGYEIERKNYVSDIMSKDIKSEDVISEPINWRTEDRSFCRRPEPESHHYGGYRGPESRWNRDYRRPEPRSNRDYRRPEPRSNRDYRRPEPQSERYRADHLQRFNNSRDYNYKYGRRTYDKY